MILHGVEQIGFMESDVLYVMGDNKWGQLGINPNEVVFLDKFEPIKIDILNENPKYNNYQIKEVECGTTHTLIMVEIPAEDNKPKQ